MKKFTMIELVLVLTGALAIASCGPTGTGKTPNPEFVRRMQNSSGCMDLPTVLASIVEAKKIKMGTTDVTIQADDKPRSDLFTSSILSYGEEPSDTSDEEYAEIQKQLKDGLSRVSQEGCKSLSIIGEDNKTFEIKITDSKPTRLVLRLVDPEDFKSFEIVIAIVANNEVEYSMGIPLPHWHYCSADYSQQVTERHNVTIAQAITWGDAPAVPAPSQHMIEQHKLSRALKEIGEKDGWVADTKAYCKAIGKPW